ncbi:unnamed protein product [Psylliodes chrysocephalus]|uniref:Uncharacterized protein n=1 Tax=Psylliodes chrysocephalus TaxID=3402493 RepID=A0A9P0GMV9_9CUCU|nr:unnamed protein product [Psylliodes chrysocephala]
MEDTCLECRQMISDSVFCECEMCGRKIHGSCAKLSTIDVKFLRSISKTFLGGLCQVCRGEIRLLPKLYRRFRELEETFENNYLSLTAMDDRINCDKLVLVDPQFDHKYKNGTDLEYEEQITTLKNEIESLQNKVQTLVTENKILSNDSKTSGDKLIDLDEKFKKILSEKRSLEERISNILENKTEENRLEDKLTFIQDECNKLKSELVRKDKEIQDIKNKFDFESAYKSLEGEYGRKISLIDELHRQKDEDNDAILNLTNVNNNLKKSLKDCKEEIQETKEKLKSREKLNSNIEQTANKVQLHVEGKSSIMSELQKLNNDFKYKIDKLEKDAEDKMKQLGHLKDILKREEVIKNKMWSDNRDLTSSLNVLTEDYQKLLSDIGENENIKKELKEDYNVMLSKYNQEMEKNRNLVSELSSHQKDLTDISSKYHELNTNYHVLVNNNLHVLEELSLLKSETECIKDHHKLYKDELNKSLHEYQNALQLLSSKLKDLEFENNILRTDLSIEKQKFSKQAVCDDKIKAAEYEDSGFKCDIESETSSESSLMSSNYEKSALPTKNLTFEKQKLTIDRLREKLDDLETNLLNERSKNDILKERLSTKEDELREGKVRISTEKNSLQSVINDLKDKLAQQEDYYKHLCNASNDKIKELSIKLSQYDELHKNLLLNLSQKESLLQRNFEMFEYNKITIEKLSKSVQDFQIQHKNMTGDLRLKEISLKNVSLENQNLKHFAARLENQQLQQSVKLSYIETALKNCEGDLCKKSEELTSLTFLLSDREERIRSLTAAAEEYERRLSDSIVELSVKDSTCVNLELELKELQNKLSRTEICRDKARADVIRMEENVKSVEVGAEMNAVKDESTFDQISGFVDVISECCNDLNIAFTKFMEQWKNRLELDPNFRKLPALKLCSSFEIGHVLSVIVDNVKVVILLFNIMSSNDPSTMGENADSYVNYLSNAKVEVNEPKVIRKFTLRPSKLDVRPVSPDSPGIEIDPQKNEEWKPENAHNSPDSQNCRTFEFGDDGEQSGRTVSSTHLPLLTFDLQLQDAFPHLSDSFLDKLGLHETSPKVKLSKDETERLFTTFAIQVALDSKDVKDRLQKQKDLCSQVHRKFVYLLKDISVRLREHKCIGATDSINPVFVMLEDVRYQMQEMMQTVGQFGVLTCENRMTKCWNLVTNYMAIIRQNTEFWKEQSSPNRLLSKGLKSPTNSPEKVLLEKCLKCEHLKASKDDKKTKEYSRYRDFEK